MSTPSQGRFGKLDRRQFIQAAAALGATAAWAGPHRHSAVPLAAEKRDLYPEGVASGDPDSSSVILWTRRPYEGTSSQTLTVEVAEDARFERVVATTATKVSPESDWTCRVLVGNLESLHVYWYRFIDATGHASRMGRTITAPIESDPRPVRFAFVSCQNCNVGEQHAYRRMIFDDERAAAHDRLGFVLHLGDFIYEVVWYPEDRPQGIYERRFRDIVRYPQGEKISDFHVPVTVDDYRAIYRAYLHDQDIQDARARWPFVCIWDNHEFSWNGWQSIQIFNGKSRPTQTRKVAANQTWFEYQPARVRKSGNQGLEQFDPPAVQDVPIERFDGSGLGDEPNNKAAIGSLTGYRAFRWGRHVELLITDQRTYRSEEPTARPEAKDLSNDDFPEMVPQEAMEILDAGRVYADGNPPASLHVGAKEIPNFRKEGPPQSVLGAEQKAWFLQHLRTSQATWKIWGNTLGTLDHRADPQNLPAGLTVPWPGSGYACFRGADASTAYVERAEIYAAVVDANITGFVTVSGDRHSFWAGLAAPTLPPKPFQPVGVAFVVGSISAPGNAEKYERGISQKHPLRSLYALQRSAGGPIEATSNLLVRHGVRSCLEFAKSGDLTEARKLSNPDLSPHLQFLDFAGHGFALVTASAKDLVCEFVCIPRPSERVAAADGGPVRYRVAHTVPMWSKGQTPKLHQRVIEGDPQLSL